MALISGIWRNRDSHALDRDRFQALRSPELPQTPWAALLPYLVSGSVGRIALEWWPLTRLCASFGISGRVTQTASLSLGSLLYVLDLAFVDRSLLHCWRCADLVFHPASFMAQPKALDCRSLLSHGFTGCSVNGHRIVGILRIGTPLNALNRARNLLGPADPVASSLRTSRLGNS